MPTRTPVLSWEQIRNYTEKWEWTDPCTGVKVKGFNPPDKAQGKRHVPYFVRYITSRGVTEQGEVITLKVDTARHQRKVKFTASNQIRIVRDYLIIEVDGVRFQVG